MLKSLTLEDEGMQELINPVPLELILDEDPDMDLEIEANQLAEQENQAMKEVIDMLEDTANLLNSSDLLEK